MKRLKMLAKSGNDLKYLMCEDWLIYSYDKNNGEIYYLNVETWGIWMNIAEKEKKTLNDVMNDPNSVEKYMLPEIQKNWNNERWSKAEEYTVWNLWGDDVDLNTEFKEHNIELPINQDKEGIIMSNLKNKLAFETTKELDVEGVAIDLKTIIDKIVISFDAIDISTNLLKSNEDMQAVLGTEVNVEELEKRFYDLTSYFEDLEKKLRDVSKKLVY